MASPAGGLLEELDLLPKAWPYPQRVAIWWGFVLVSQQDRSTLCAAPPAARPLAPV